MDYINEQNDKLRPNGPNAY